MRRTWKRLLVVSVTVAGLSCACGGSTPKESADQTEEPAEPAAETSAAPVAAPALPPAAAPSQVEDLGNDRPAQVTVTLAGNKAYDGTYHGGGYHYFVTFSGVGFVGSWR
jgi:hypothetical protein